MSSCPHDLDDVLRRTDRAYLPFCVVKSGLPPPFASCGTTRTVLFERSALSAFRRK
jgi:hypothetical protein